jgi:drug/metabolite transporter (DMT)-like permease
MPISPTVLGSLFVLTSAGLSGALGPVLRLLYDQGVTPIAFTVWRGIVAGSVLLGYLAWRRRRDPSASIVPRGLPRRERLALVGFTASNIVLNTSAFIAFDRIPVAVALIIFYTYPALLAVYGAVTRTERLSATKTTALVLALGGLVLVVGADPGAASGVPLDPVGLALAMLASIGGAAWVIFGRACPSVSAPQAMGSALGASIVVVGGATVLAGSAAELTFPLVNPQILPALIAMAAFSGAAAAPMFTAGMRLISRVRAGILALIEPLVGSVAAALVLGQVLAPLQVAGGLLVLAAALLIQRDREDAIPVTPVETPAADEVAAPGVV